MVATSQRRRRWAALIAAAGVCLLGAANAKRASAETASEREVKAAFLMNFTRFVDWPRSAFLSSSEPFVVGVLGGDEIEQILRGLMRNKTLNGRPMSVQRVNAGSLKSCQIVFVPESEERQIGEVLRATKGLPVLTVGESRGFAERGGLINFVVQDRRVRFEVNPGAAVASQIKISSKLLDLAILTAGRE